MKFIRMHMVEAEPMTRGEYNNKRGWEIPFDENPADEGYIVKYPDGYMSWCPKEKFEKDSFSIDGEQGAPNAELIFSALQIYHDRYYATPREKYSLSDRLIRAFYNEFVGRSNGCLTFGMAIEAMKRGMKVARKGWNGNLLPPIVPPAPKHDFKGRIDIANGLVYLRLNNGDVAICDYCDLDKVQSYRWSATADKKHAFRTVCGSNGKRHNLFLHQAILGKMKGFCIDHINGNGLDCRRCNMRYCTIRENNANSMSRKGSSSQFKGVTYDKSRGKWNAAIEINGKTKMIGRFENEVEAARAYDKEAYKKYGQFARLNFQETVFLPRMFLWMKPATQVKSEWCKDEMLKGLVEENGGEILGLGTVCMYTHDSTGRNAILTGWSASQTDMISEDWMIVEF